MTEPLIHQTADVAPLARLGAGTRVWNNVQIREGATVGQDCIVGKDVYIDKDVVIGDRVKIQNGAQLYRPLLIEDGVFIGPQVVFVNDRVPRSVTPEGVLKSEADWEQKQTIVREGASIGAHATVLPGVEIGAWALIGAAALVTADVGAHSLILGVPGRPCRWVCRCGARLLEEGDIACPDCLRRYHVSPLGCVELPPRVR